MTSAHDTGDGSPEMVPDGGQSDVQREEQADYMDVEINLLSPQTPFMRDHARLIWTGAIIWVFTTFGPITLTAIATEPMTQVMPVLGFPFHYFLLALFSPTASLILAFWYARARDSLDEKYNITQPTAQTDGGVSQ